MPFCWWKTSQRISQSDVPSSPFVQGVFPLTKGTNKHEEHKSVLMPQELKHLFETFTQTKTPSTSKTVQTVLPQPQETTGTVASDCNSTTKRPKARSAATKTWFHPSKIWREKFLLSFDLGDYSLGLFRGTMVCGVPILKRLSKQMEAIQKHHLPLSRIFFK